MRFIVFNHIKNQARSATFMQCVQIEITWMLFDKITISPEEFDSKKDKFNESELNHCKLQQSTHI